MQHKVLGARSKATTAEPRGVRVGFNADVPFALVFGVLGFIVGVTPPMSSSPDMRSLRCFEAVTDIDAGLQFAAPGMPRVKT